VNLSRPGPRKPTAPTPRCAARAGCHRHHAVAAGFLDRVVPAADLRDVAAASAAGLAALDMSAHAASKLRARDHVLSALRAAIDIDDAAITATGPASHYDSAAPRAKQRTQELRDHVLHVAISMLGTDGVTGFTTRKVAQQADSCCIPPVNCSGPA